MPMSMFMPLAPCFRPIDTSSLAVLCKLLYRETDVASAATLQVAVLEDD